MMQRVRHTRQGNGTTTAEYAARALALLVRAEYGDRYSLSYIAETWGEGIDPVLVGALRRWEGALVPAEAGDELVHDAGERS
jgi:hypothetical protein